MMPAPPTAPGTDRMRIGRPGTRVAMLPAPYPVEPPAKHVVIAGHVIRPRRRDICLTCPSTPSLTCAIDAEQEHASFAKTQHAVADVHAPPPNGPIPLSL